MRVKSRAAVSTKNQILHRYYPQFSSRKRSPEECFMNFCKRNNVLWIMDEDIYCLKLAEEVRGKFRPNPVIDSDPFLSRDHLALVNSLVFFLYWGHEPNQGDFRSVIQMLRRAKEQVQQGGIRTDLDVVYARNRRKKPKHTGSREYRVFRRTRSREGAYVIIDDILQNFRNAPVCERLFDSARRKIER